MNHIYIFLALLKIQLLLKSSEILMRESEAELVCAELIPEFGVGCPVPDGLEIHISAISLNAGKCSIFFYSCTVRLLCLWVSLFVSQHLFSQTSNHAIHDLVYKKILIFVGIYLQYLVSRVLA